MMARVNASSSAGTVGTDLEHLALRASVLVDDPAGMAFPEAVRLTGTIHRLPAALGACKLPAATSASTWLLQRQVGHQPAQAPVLSLKLLQPMCLVDLQPAVLLAPAIDALLASLGPLARHRNALALFRARLLTSPHAQLLGPG